MMCNLSLSRVEVARLLLSVLKKNVLKPVSILPHKQGVLASYVILKFLLAGEKL